MKAYRVMARSLKTRIRVERQQLDGRLITEEDLAWQLARDFAKQQSERTLEQWQAEVESYNTRN